MDTATAAEAHAVTSDIVEVFCASAERTLENPPVIKLWNLNPGQNPWDNVLKHFLRDEPADSTFVLVNSIEQVEFLKRVFMHNDWHNIEYLGKNDDLNSVEQFENRLTGGIMVLCPEDPASKLFFVISINPCPNLFVY